MGDQIWGWKDGVKMNVNDQDLNMQEGERGYKGYEGIETLWYMEVYVLLVN